MAKKISVLQRMDIDRKLNKRNNPALTRDQRSEISKKDADYNKKAAQRKEFWSKFDNKTMTSKGGAKSVDQMVKINSKKATRKPVGSRIPGSVIRRIGGVSKGRSK